MEYKFEDYKIHIDKSNNYANKYVAYIEEFFNVIDIIDNEKQAPERLKLLFDKEINRLKDNKQQLPPPGNGKARITFATNDRIEELRPFIDDFWFNIIGTTYITSFISDYSTFESWEHYLRGGKKEIIQKVKQTYSIDISSIYDKPIHEILTILKNKNC
jgi:hypothetical protein